MRKLPVYAYANLRKFTDGRPVVEVQVSSATCVREVLRDLAIPEQQAKLIFVDNRPAELDTSLASAKRIDLFSAIGGG